MLFLTNYKYLVNPFFFCSLSFLYLIISLYAIKYYRGYIFSIKNLKSYIKLYNLIQIGVCSYIVYGFYEFFDMHNIYGIGLKYYNNIEYFIFIHYLSKYLDWFDTLWMVLNNKSEKQITFLHIYHHSTVNLIWGYLLYTGNGNGTIYFGAMINSFIHVLMYTHYLVTSFGLKNPSKKLMTTLQLFQFLLCFLHSVEVLFYYKESANYPVNLAWLQFFYQISMLYLFKFKLNWQPFVRFF
jgi:elongation of very long chain fatty acids protein 4